MDQPQPITIVDSDLVASLKVYYNIDPVNWRKTNEFLKKVMLFASDPDVKVFVGHALTEAKCVVRDINGIKHFCDMDILPSNNLKITGTDLPQAPFEDGVLPDVKELVERFKIYVNEMAKYCSQLDNIDKNCAVVEPAKPSYKSNTRKIMLDRQTWLHVTVSAAGKVSDIHLLGSNNKFSEQLEQGLTRWDDELDFITNFKSIFSEKDLCQVQLNVPSGVSGGTEPQCSICLQLSDSLCDGCGTHFHSACLLEVCTPLPEDMDPADRPAPPRPSPGSPSPGSPSTGCSSFIRGVPLFPRGHYVPYVRYPRHHIFMQMLFILYLFIIIFVFNL